MRLEKATFGPVLRAARERRGVALEQIAAETKLAVELWADLEDNNFARWPRQIYARSYVRDYALRVGLDADEIVNEFCRLFPEWGDRRAERLIRGQAAIVNHDLTWDDPAKAPRRRASDRENVVAPGFFGRHRFRLFAALCDLGAIAAVTGLAAALRLPFWPSLALTAVGYVVAGRLLSERGFGAHGADWLEKLALFSEHHNPVRVRTL